MLSLNMVINDCPTTILFNWYGEEPDWDSMEVIALLPTPEPLEAKYWVKINDVLGDKEWMDIRAEIFWNQDDLMRQRDENDY
jgi:hypothetical protein